MLRFWMSALLLVTVSVAARAHFVFIVPVDGKQQGQVVFSDSLEPDSADLLKKIAHTRFVARVGDKTVKLTPKNEGKYLSLEVPARSPTWVSGVCRYGVVSKGKTPFLLMYYCKAVVGVKAGDRLPPAPDVDLGLRLNVVPVLGGRGGPIARILWEGKPLKDVEVTLTIPGKKDHVKTISDAAGAIKLPAPEKAGMYAILAGFSEASKGNDGDKSYSVVRHYSSCVFPVALGIGAARSARAADKPAENPEATKLLADARAARANWDGFPGFSANVEVNVDGKVSRGKVKVSAKGKVDLELDGDQKGWAKGMLSSLVGHRLDDATTLTTPCAFADDVTDHPLGRSIRVLNDEFHSSYRIRDRQVIEVNRRMGDVRFTITVIENRLTADKKYLPRTYVVNNWDVKTGALRTSVTHHNTWTRVGKFDLPDSVMVVTALEGKQMTRSIRLTDYRLLK